MSWGGELHNFVMACCPRWYKCSTARPATTPLRVAIPSQGCSNKTGAAKSEEMVNRAPPGICASVIIPAFPTELKQDATEVAAKDQENLKSSPVWRLPEKPILFAFRYPKAADWRQNRDLVSGTP